MTDQKKPTVDELLSDREAAEDNLRATLLQHGYDGPFPFVRGGFELGAVALRWGAGHVRGVSEVRGDGGAQRPGGAGRWCADRAWGSAAHRVAPGAEPMTTLPPDDLPELATYRPHVGPRPGSSGRGAIRDHTYLRCVWCHAVTCGNADQDDPCIEPYHHRVPHRSRMGLVWPIGGDRPKPVAR